MSKSGMFGSKGSGDTSGFSGLVKSETVIGSAQRPYGGYFDQVADDLERAYPLFSDAIEQVVVDRGELTLFIKPDRLTEVAKILRDQLRFEMCVGVNGVHYPDQTNRELHERETYDMFGIIFDNHPGLTRILMPDDWAGFPQRKDYPLGGIEIEYKGATVPAPSQRRSYT